MSAKGCKRLQGEYVLNNMCIIYIHICIATRLIQIISWWVQTCKYWDRDDDGDDGDDDDDDDDGDINGGIFLVVLG